MRNIFMLGLSFCLLSCNAGKRMATVDRKVVVISGCSDQASCSGVIHGGKRLEVAVSEDGSRNYALADDDQAAVLVLSYERILPLNVQDGQYREEIIIEIPVNTVPVDIHLSTTSKAVFGRFCYCKGSTGYYPVSSGQLKIEKKDGTLTGHISFRNNDVPQIWMEASFAIQ